MPETYSMDFRRAVVRHVETGVSCSQTARLFGTSRSFVINLVRRYRETGDLSPDPRGGVRRSKLTDVHHVIVAWIEEQPDITLREMVERLAQTHAMTASVSGLSDMLARSGFTYKKNHAGQRSRAWTPPPAAP